MRFLKVRCQWMCIWQGFVQFKRNVLFSQRILLRTMSWYSSYDSESVFKQGKTKVMFQVWFTEWDTRVDSLVRPVLSSPRQELDLCQPIKYWDWHVLFMWPLVWILVILLWAVCTWFQVAPSSTQHIYSYKRYHRFITLVLTSPKATLLYVCPISIFQGASASCF